MLPLPQQNLAKQLSKLGFFHQSVKYFVEKSENKQKVLCIACGSGNSFFSLPEIRFLAYLDFHQITLS